MLPSDDPGSNRLLGALGDADWRGLQPLLERVDLRAGQVLYEAGVPQTHAVFLTSASVSLLHVLRDGETTEVAIVGHEGFVGVALLLGGHATTGRGVVQQAGSGFRIGARALRDTFARSADFRGLLLRYIQALYTQLAQTSVCKRHHRIEQQLCRALLQQLDCHDGNLLAMTQAQLAEMLGVRREGVTAAAHRLQADGVIRYARGRLAVIDRAALEHRSCECYAVVRKEWERLLPAPRTVRRAPVGWQGWPRWAGATDGSRASVRDDRVVASL